MADFLGLWLNPKASPGCAARKSHRASKPRFWKSARNSVAAIACTLVGIPVYQAASKPSPYVLQGQMAFHLACITESGPLTWARAALTSSTLWGDSELAPSPLLHRSHTARDDRAARPWSRVGITRVALRHDHEGRIDLVFRLDAGLVAHHGGLAIDDRDAARLRPAFCSIGLVVETNARQSLADRSAHEVLDCRRPAMAGVASRITGKTDRPRIPTSDHQTLRR